VAYSGKVEHGNLETLALANSSSYHFVHFMSPVNVPSSKVIIHESLQPFIPSDPAAKSLAKDPTDSN
jgi:hypothetical protein